MLHECADGHLHPIRDAGDASSTVTANGSFGSEPQADFPTPLITDGVQASVLTKGDGKTVFAGEYASTQVTLYDGKTGEYLTSTSYDEAAAFLLSVLTSSDVAALVQRARSPGTPGPCSA